MIHYLIKRFFSGLIILFIYISVMFVLAQEVLPGDYVSQFALQLSPNESQELRQRLGLDRPILKRYFEWIKNLVRGDLGESYTPFGPMPRVSDVVKATLPPTMLIFGIGTALAFFTGQWLGKVAAWRGNGFLTSTITFGSIAFYTSFPPWLSFLLVYILSIRLNLPFSLGGRALFRVPGTSDSAVITQMLIELGLVVIILLLLNVHLKRLWRRSIPGWLFLILIPAGWVAGWYFNKMMPSAIDILRRAALPTLIYTLLSFGEIMMIMRTTMVDTLHEDYIQTARAKGLPEHLIRDHHAARNALLPVMSRLVISLPFLLSGMVMIEEVLHWDGIGSALFYAVGTQNIPLAVGMFLVIGVLSLVARIALDVIQAALDPSIRAA
jgi:peptide/nickel transport system permease protein